MAILNNSNLLKDAQPRRRFLVIIIWLINGLIALALVVPGLAYLLTPLYRKSSSSWIKLGALGDFSAVHPQKVVFKYLAEDGFVQSKKTGFVWVLTNSDDPKDMTVFSPVCSHTGCNVAWQANDEKFVCPCHNGRYNLNGEVVSGPPPKPLTRLQTRIENGQVFIQLLG